EQSRRLRVDDELEFGRLNPRQVSGVRALEDLTGVDPDLTIIVQNIGPVAHQPAGFDNLALAIGCRNPIARRECRKLDSSGVEEPLRGDEQGISTLLCTTAEGRLPPAARPAVDDLNLQSEGACSVREVS